MVIRRRAVASASVAGSLALLTILLLRQLFATPTDGLKPFDLGAPVGLAAAGGAAENVPLSEQARIVSMRERAEALARAQVWREPRTPLSRVRFATNAGMPSSVQCQFRFTDLGGTTPKFDCVLDSGKELRVKYGPGSDVPAEAASSRLLTALGFGADNVTLVEQLHCLGCPNEAPFVIAKVTGVTGTEALFERVVNDEGRQEFEWVAVEQKFNARPIESEAQRGWAFFELDSVNPAKGGAPRAHVDALRLLAVFLAHWDNRAENQRLVCLDETWVEGTACPEPFLLMQDVGSTFGPNRVDLDAWAQSRIWNDRNACKLSMDELPYDRGTFGPVRISERGRRFLGKQLDELTDAQLTELFTWARFDQARGVPMPTRPVADWVRVFKARVQQINEGPPCPDA